MSLALRDLKLGVLGGRARLFGRSGLVLAGVVFAIAIVGAAIERHVTVAGAVDRTLVGVFGLLIPLSTFAWVRIVTGARRLTERAVTLSRFGASGRMVTAGLGVASIAAAASTSVLAVAIAVLVSRAGADPGRGEASLAAELFTSSWIGALTSAAYGAWFNLGATFLRRGSGRWVPLVGDFVLGSAGALGILLPRAHAENLVGGAAPLGFGQPASSAMLLGLAVVLLALTILRARP